MSPTAPVFALVIALGWTVGAPCQARAAASEAASTKVTFQSHDGKTTLVGYLFTPAGGSQGNRPAIVMLHGRAGPYSSAANGRYDETTLSKRHETWGEYWATQGYVALLVDSFGPRGYPQGFPIHSYDDRPEAVNEVTVRPLDAYGALNYLRTQALVDPSRIALQGWSNGGSATLATMSDAVFAENRDAVKTGFVGAVSFYPACALHDRFAAGYRPYAPVRVFSGDKDEEVSFKRCAELVHDAASKGGPITIDVFPGATHGFDDPGEKRQQLFANRRATDIAVEQTQRFFARLFGRP
jgi:dienelactone hydrolase